MKQILSKIHASLLVLIGIFSLSEARGNSSEISWICNTQDQKPYKMTLWKTESPNDRPWLLGANLSPLVKNLGDEGLKFNTNIYLINEPNLKRDNRDPDYIFDITYKYVESGENLFFQSKWFDSTLLFQMSGKNAWITVLKGQTLRQLGPLVCNLQ